MTIFCNLPQECGGKVQALRFLFFCLEKMYPSISWWPGDSDFEIMVGAILTQNTNWHNVEKALAVLKQKNLLTEKALWDLDTTLLSEYIRSAGYSNVKARYLKNLCRWLLDHEREWAECSNDDLRQALLSIKGIGEETADDILLYVYHRPMFIYDLYARRLLERLGFGAFSTYKKAKQSLDASVFGCGFSVKQLQDWHGRIVEFGKRIRRDGDSALRELTE